MCGGSNGGIRQGKQPCRCPAANLDASAFALAERATCRILGWEEPMFQTRGGSVLTTSGEGKSLSFLYKRSSCKEDPFSWPHTQWDQHGTHTPQGATQSCSEQNPACSPWSKISFETIKDLPSHLTPACSCVVGLLLVEGLLCFWGGTVAYWLTPAAAASKKALSHSRWLLQARLPVSTEQSQDKERAEASRRNHQIK